MTDEVNADPLESLRKRWELEKSPMLSLQLAEEYGRREDYLSAITVLRSGLSQHPRHVASRILLARYLVELEQWPEARETLEKVAAEDPTHLIANKLLVKTHIATGELAEARNRLDLYRLLNERDPDTEELERALLAAGAGAGAAAESVEWPPPPPSAADEPPVAEEPSEPAPAPPEEALPATPPPIASTAAAAADAGAERIPPAVAAPEPQPAGAPEEVRADPFPATRGAPSAEPFGDLFGGDARARADREEAEIFDLAPPRPYDRAEVRDAAAAAPAGEETLQAVEPPPTVALGRLYLDQGHREEAERIFVAVLESQPDNAVARSGLAAARARREWAVTALDLLPREALAAGPLTRKRAVLTGYLERLRSAVDREAAR